MSDGRDLEDLDLVELELPGFMFWQQKFREATDHWTDEQVGCYLRLLMHQWRHGSIPGNERQRRRITDSYEESWPVVAKKFRDRGDGELVNDVLESERERAALAWIQRSNAGKASALAKARKRAERRRRSTAVATAESTAVKRTLPRPSDKKKEERSEKEDQRFEIATATDAHAREDAGKEAIRRHDEDDWMSDPRSRKIPEEVAGG